MALDARLADPVLLALAARRAKQRQQTAPRQTIRVRVQYEDPFNEGPMEGDGAEFHYELPPQPGERTC